MTETDVDITVDNGSVRITVSKVSASRLTSLQLHGTELLGGGRGNYDMNNAREGDPLPLPPPGNTVEVRQGQDFVDIAFRYSPTNGGPFWLERHHILRSGESGLHLATVFHHTPELHGFRSDQHRYVFYLDPAMFTHLSVEDDPIGDAWRAGAAQPGGVQRRSGAAGPHRASDRQPSGTSGGATGDPLRFPTGTGGRRRGMAEDLRAVLRVPH